ncbi:hypothetical protein PG988_006768 [Apiospora saccharicola]
MSVRSAPDSPLASSLAKRVKTGHAGNSFFNDPIVKIEVDDGASGRLTWYLHRAPLLDQSKDFRYRLENGGDTILLRDTSPETVDTFSHWLYTRSLDVAELRLDTPYDEDKDESLDQASVDNDGDNEAAEEGECDSNGWLYEHYERTDDINPTSPVDPTGNLLERDTDSASVASSESATLQYAIPTLERDALDLLQCHREAHRVNLNPSIDVLVYACYNNHFYADDDPLWRWLASDFARTELCSPGSIDAMCEQLPPRFWQTAFKAKIKTAITTIDSLGAGLDAVSADHDALETVVEERDQEIRDLKMSARCHKEQLANLHSQAAVDAEELDSLRGKALTDFMLKTAQLEEIQSFRTRTNYAEEVRLKLVAELKSKDDQLADLQAMAAADHQHMETLRNEVAAAEATKLKCVTGLKTALEQRNDYEAKFQTQAEQVRQLQSQAAADAEALASLRSEAEQVAELQSQESAIDQFQCERAYSNACLAEADKEIKRVQAMLDACAQERGNLEARINAMVEKESGLEARITRDALEIETLQMRATLDAEELTRLRAHFSGDDETDEQVERSLAIIVRHCR